MPRTVWFTEDIANGIRGVRHAMLKSNRSDDYLEATEDFAAALSDTFGIGVVDERGDLWDIGRLGSGPSNRPAYQVTILSNEDFSRG